MEKRDFVLSWHPDAVLVEVPPIWSATISVPLEPGYWVVYASSDRSAVELGRGTTCSGAWADAASKLNPEFVRIDIAAENEQVAMSLRAPGTARQECNPDRLN